MKLRLTNTLSKQKEFFTAPKSGPIKLYVCGITPYDYAHIGHGRVYVTFDILTRFLKFLGHTVTYIRNVTDIDDKLINKATMLSDGSTYKDVAERYFEHFKKDMQALNCQEPSAEPRVTECIPEIIAFIKELIDNGNAYALDGDVYFNITSFPAYGKLSGRDIKDLLAGARVEVNSNKKNAGDFALWKGNNDGLFWQSPWGYGRPGWHIECSVMAKKLLGDTIDIHGGGMDLIFPHHENEIAQSESLHHKAFAHTWMHNAFININKEKMSKSLGNSVTLRDLLTAYDPMVLRFFYIQHHYRSPIDFTDSELVAAQTAYKKLVGHFSMPANPLHLAMAQTSHQLVHELCSALGDDLNTPKFLGIIFEHIDTIKQDPGLYLFTKAMIQTTLGLKLEPLAEEIKEITPEIEALLKKREEARKAKDWALADSIRDELTALGYVIQDKKTK